LRWQRRKLRLGATAQTWVYDAKTGTETLRIFNISKKTITAYRIGVDTTYSDGSKVYNAIGTDSAGSISRKEPNSGLLPEDHKDVEFGIGARPGLAVSSIEAHLSFVIYDDGTSEAENDKDVEEIFAERRSAMETMQKIAETVQKIVDDPTDEQPVVTALQIVTELAMQAGRDHAPGATGGRSVYQVALPNLKRAQVSVLDSNPPLTERDWLEAHFVKPNLDRAAGLKPLIERRVP